MRTKHAATALAAAILAAALTLGTARPAAAHCDAEDGPVATVARAALESGELAPVLAWVREQDEAEVAAAFARARQVRAAGGEARALADRWFLETVVRLHREGEGAPFTGLQPAGQPVPAGVAAADRAVAGGSADELAARAGDHVTRALRERYARVAALRDRDPADVAVGRAYVHAYVEFVHTVERLHRLLEGEAHGH
jgi:hypothetical protein